MDYYSINTSDSLLHYGVKGMKWKNHQYATDDGNGNDPNKRGKKGALGKVTSSGLSGTKRKAQATLAKMRQQYSSSKSTATGQSLASKNKVDLKKKKAAAKSAKAHEESAKRNAPNKDSINVEYALEKAFNNKKNVYPEGFVDQSKKKTNTQDRIYRSGGLKSNKGYLVEKTLRETVIPEKKIKEKTIDEEYLREKAYNSKKNKGK